MEFPIGLKERLNMQNKQLPKDYLSRSQKRLVALLTLKEQEAWADVVREAQEIVELSLKGLLKYYDIDVPRVHDVSNVLQQEKESFPKELKKDLDKVCKISKELRRDRELAFYGSEDLTPEEFYEEEDAEKAYNSASFVVSFVKKFIV